MLQAGAMASGLSPMSIRSPARTTNIRGRPVARGSVPRAEDTQRCRGLCPPGASTHSKSVLVEGGARHDPVSATVDVVVLLIFGEDQAVPGER